jgi:hypothetical protein
MSRKQDLTGFQNLSGLFLMTIGFKVKLPLCTRQAGNFAFSRDAAERYVE